MAQNFQVDTSDYLGFKYEEYLNELMAIAMSKPSEYYKIWADTLKALKQDVIKAIYDTYYIRIVIIIYNIASTLPLTMLCATCVRR